MQFRFSAISAAALLIGTLSVAGAADSVTVKLNAQNGSGETGTATLTPVDGGVKVAVKINGSGDVAQPIHIHEGTCAKLNPKPAYPLTTVASGTSTTTVKGVTLGQLENGDYAINVHKSTSDIPTYVACGDIPAVKGSAMSGDHGAMSGDHGAMSGDHGAMSGGSMGAMTPAPAATK